MSKAFASRVCRIVLMALVIGALALGGTAQAAESRLDTILDRGVLRVGTTGDYKPFTFYDEDTGEHEGIDIEMARSLADALGVELKLVRTTWGTLIDGILEDKYDVAMGGISIRLSRQAKVFFTIPYLETGKAPITLDENVERFQTIEQIDRPDVRVIVNPGGTNERFARENFDEAEIILHDSNVTIFEEIVKGNADLMITDAVETLVQERLHPELEAVHPHDPFTFTEFGYILPRGDVVFKEWLDLWLHTSMETGEFEEIFEKHVGGN
ncbi:MAG: transporter substrate-binding domain-containing protein [Synergistales bacterium]|nr:transporter substrate-binding domain-containing protein [Synergistales bacterium]